MSVDVDVGGADGAFEVEETPQKLPSGGPGPAILAMETPSSAGGGSQQSLGARSESADLDELRQKPPSSLRGRKGSASRRQANGGKGTAADDDDNGRKEPGESPLRRRRFDLDSAC
eukprot:CAMPEP_0118986114 /NCGR_PEP_ID=MMETSP1173-20130426/41496_1 /TAXON_ID=1034831 /ORGANISM="Rhizochromulina marina cf, Strain CCMP1243" /LENGTH=115 /DNA_ID=CAMNT_0006936875 /DNA_START=60 /DNA_END=404 /DNA_ORIENTATION=-